MTITHDRPTATAAPAASFATPAWDWPVLEQHLDRYGWVVLPNVLAAAECGRLSDLYGRDELFRKHVDMERQGFGRGQYKYFHYPLPDRVNELRRWLYPQLVPMANRWREAMGSVVRYPTVHEEFRERCRQAGQSRPTPLILQYGPDDYNCLHQDLYGEHVFPFQAAVLLSVPGQDFSGGEFVLTEQRPRQQSRVEVVPLGQGDAVIFAVSERPVRGVRGYRKVNLRHGVSRVRSGQRRTLGIIFHDAR